MGLAVAVAAMATGCSVNPVVQWRAERDPAPGIDAALADAQALRTQFETRAEQYLGRKLVTNDLLYGLGVASFAAVAAGAHKDVLATTAGLGGSTYVYSTFGLQQSVLNAYQLGIGRVNCAAAIGRKMRVDPAVLALQRTSINTLQADIPRLAAAISRAEVLVLGTPGLDAAYKAAAVERMAAARTALAGALAVNMDADTLSERSAFGAGKLIGTLQAIHQAVNEMAALGVPESKAVLEALKSLAGAADDFGRAVKSAAPGAAASAAGAGSGPANQSDAGRTNLPGPSVAASAPAASIASVSNALVQMAELSAKVTLVADAMRERAKRLANTVDADDFDKCVPDASRASGFRVAEATLNFTANKDDDQSQTFTVDGGTTNYTARFTSQPTFGITLIQPAAGGRVFEVKVPKTTRGPHELAITVEDSSPARNRATVMVKVAPSAPSATGDAAAANQSAAGRATDLPAALAMAQKSGAAIAFGPGTVKSRLTIRTWSTDAVGTRVVLACEPGGQPAKIGNLEARTRLLALLTEGFALSPAVADTARRKPASLAIVSDGGCLK